MPIADRLRAALAALAAPSLSPVAAGPASSATASADGSIGTPSAVLGALRATADWAWLGAAQLRNRLRGTATLGDPRQANRWENRQPYNDPQIAGLGRNGVARRAVSTRVLDAMRPGHTLDLRSVASGERQELAKLLESYAQWLKLRQKFKRALVWSEEYGHSIIVMGIDDGQADLSLPVKEDSIRAVRWLKAFARPRYEIGELSTGAPSAGSPNGREPGLPEWYEIEDLSEPEVEAYKLNQGLGQQNKTRVHWTRVLGPFHTSDGHSRYDEVGEALEDFFTTHDAAERFAATMSIGHHRIAGWNARTAQDEDAARGRVRVVAEGISATNNIITDMHEEEFGYVPRSASGLGDIVDRKQVLCCAATGLPAMKFFGLDPAGFSSGAEVMDGYNNSVEEVFVDQVEPELRRFYSLLQRAADLRAERADDFGITMLPLRTPSASELVDMRVKVWNAGRELAGGPLLDRDEVRTALFGAGASDVAPTIQLSAADARDGEEGAVLVGTATNITAIMQAAQLGGEPDAWRAALQAIAPQVPDELVMRMIPDRPAVDPTGAAPPAVGPDGQPPVVQGDGLENGEAPKLPGADRWVTPEEIATDFGTITAAQLKNRAASRPGLGVNESDAKGPRLHWIKPGRGRQYRLSEVRAAFEGGGPDLDPTTADTPGSPLVTASTAAPAATAPISAPTPEE